MHKCDLYQEIKKGSNLIRCTACAHSCVIANGKTGICQVRINKNGKLYLTVFGEAVAINVDPVEKKPLYHFYPGQKVFSIGTVGCNFACSFCQNWDISQAIKLLKKQKPNIKFDEVNFGYKLMPEKVVKYCLENNIKLIAFTYNEPTIFAEYAKSVMKLAKKYDIKGILVTNGYETNKTLDYLDGFIDAYNVDLKSFSEEFYKKICKASLKPVLSAIKEIYKRGKWLEITTLLIPGENDSNEEIRQIANFIASISKNIPWHISAFHPDYKMQDKSITSFATLKRALEIGNKTGLKYIYLGNVVKDGFADTICPNCKKKLIKRNYFKVEEINIKNSKCPYCGTKIPGYW